MKIRNLNKTVENIDLFLIVSGVPKPNVCVVFGFSQRGLNPVGTRDVSEEQRLHVFFVGFGTTLTNPVSGGDRFVSRVGFPIRTD